MGAPARRETLAGPMDAFLALLMCLALFGTDGAGINGTLPDGSPISPPAVEAPRP
ncbi:MAG TPA: hypothetical protein VIL49_04335 [Capillimicrobium sp.]|jgi:hypothetical protein